MKEPIKNLPGNEVMREAYKIVNDALVNAANLLKENGGEFKDMTIFCFYDDKDEYGISPITKPS